MSKNRLDEAIDRAVREMLDVEPPAGLRGRVLDRIESPRPSFGWLWIAGPLAAAAVVVLAVLAPWRSDVGIGPPPFHGPGDKVLAVESSPRPPLAESPKTVPPVRVADSRPRTPRIPTGLVVAADAAGEDTNFSTVRALDGPASIAVERLARPEPPAIRSIEPAPLQISPLAVNALSETPRERREE